MDPSAIERLAERMQRSRAQEASITKEIADHDESLSAERNPAKQATTAEQIAHHDEPDPSEIDSHRVTQRQPLRRRIEDDYTIPRDQLDQTRDERAENAAPEPPLPQPPGFAPAPLDMRYATAADVQVAVHDLGEIRLAYSQLYDLHGYTGQETYVLFGGWQTNTEQGFVAVTHSPQGTDVQISREDRGEQNIETELAERIEKGIEHSHTREAPPQDASSPQAHPEQPSEQPPQDNQSAQRDQTPQLDQPAQLEPAEHNSEQGKDADRDPYIQQAIQEAQDRQQAFEQGIEPDQDIDRGFGIE